MDNPEAFRLQLLIRLAVDLGPVANRLSRLAGLPDFIHDEDHPRHLYSSPDWSTYEVLKLVRIVSGLHAAGILIGVGHGLEAGAILRMVHDYIGDVCFAHDARRPGETTAAQDSELAQFFYDYKGDEEKQITGSFDKPYTPRRKVHSVQTSGRRRSA
jgi:hypothetical protein